MTIGGKWRSLRGRFLTRVVAGMLIVSLPMAIALTVLLTRSGSTSLTKSADTRSEQVARSVALHLESYVAERQADLAIIARTASTDLGSPEVRALVVRIDKISSDYDLIEVTDLTGQVYRRQSPDRPVQPQRRILVPHGGRRPAGDHHTGQGRQRHPVGPRRTRARPLRAPDRRRGRQPRRSSPAGHPQSGTADRLRRRGGRRRAPPRLLDRVRHDRRQGAPGQRSPQHDHHQPCGDAGRGRQERRGASTAAAVATSSPATTGSTAWTGPSSSRNERPRSWHRVRDGRDLSIVLVLIGAALAIGFSIIFARRTTRPITALGKAAEAVAAGDLTGHVDPSGADEVRGLGESFNGMVAGLGALVNAGPFGQYVR